MPTLRPDDHIFHSLTAFIKDVGNQFQVNARYQAQDTALLHSRLASEGLGFVTKTLPKFGKHFDNALKSGQFHTCSFFKKRKGSALPSFMQGLTRKVFNHNGTLLDNPDCDAVRLVRQVCFMFYKLEADYPPELVNECINNFVETDFNLVGCDAITPDKAACVHHASDIITQLFRDFDPSDISPRPGPGQCSTKVGHAWRYEPQCLYDGIHQKYPYYSYFYCNSTHLLDRVQNYRRLPRRATGVSRIAIVPKDSRGPRIICMEPPEYMWLQQGLARSLMKHIERHPLTRGHVNFTDQSINGKLALSSSSDSRYATLDMKEASDRISKNLVGILFDGVPKLRDSLLALSTEFIELPNGAQFRKKKFAPMGSALCFPVMSIVHFALGLAAMQAETQEKPARLREHLYVYGDDLIVTKNRAKYLLEAFPAYDLMFNVDKCCQTGKFRESCGVDAYNGVDVTPQRVKTYSLTRKSPSAIQTHLAMFHGFFKRGLWGVASVWRQKLEDTCGRFPCVSDSSAALGWKVPRAQVHLANQGGWKWDKNTQQPCIKARVIVARPSMSMIGGWEQFLRAHLHVIEGNSSDIVLRGREKISWSRIPLSRT